MKTLACCRLLVLAALVHAISASSSKLVSAESSVVHSRSLRGPRADECAGTLNPGDTYYCAVDMEGVRVQDYLVVSFNETKSEEGDEGATFFIGFSGDSASGSHKRVDGDPLAFLTTSGYSYLYKCTDACVVEVNCDLGNGTYVMAVVGQGRSAVSYNMTWVRRSVSPRMLLDSLPQPMFYDSWYSVLMELGYSAYPPPSYPDHAQRYRFFAIEIPQERVSAGSYLVVNVSRVTPMGAGLVRVQRGALPLDALDNGVIGLDDSECMNDVCVDTALPKPNNGSDARPFFVHPIRSMPRTPCGCAPSVQPFGDGSFQLTCNVTVDPCHFEWGTWYISVQLPASASWDDGSGMMSYTIEASLVRPTIFPLSAGTLFSGFVMPDRAAHYALSVADGTAGRLSVRVSDISNGSVDVYLHRGEGPGKNLAGGREGCAAADAFCTASDSCVVGEYVRGGGEYYVTLEVTFEHDGVGPYTGSFVMDDDTQPVLFSLQADLE